MEIISRKEALERGLKRYFTGKPCKRGHVAERQSSNGTCMDCYAEDVSGKYREKRVAQSRRYYRENLESRKEYDKRRWQKIRHKVADKNRERVLLWQKENRDRANFNSSQYRASKRNAAPSWLTDEDIKNMCAVYEMSYRLSKCLGIHHHVDHIVPLRGDVVCGLHVPWNLAAIPAKVNLSKGNKLLTEPSFKDQGDV